MRQGSALETLGFMIAQLWKPETWRCLSMRLWNGQNMEGIDLLSGQGIPDWITGWRGQQPKGGWDPELH